MTRSAIVNEATNVVENIIVSDPVTPSPFAGTIMVGLEDPVYQNETVTVSTDHPAGTIVDINPDGSITLIYPDGTKENYPVGTTVVTNQDTTVTTTVVEVRQILVSPGTPCGIGWIYNPATGTFSEF